MRTFKLYGIPYKLEETSSVPADAYGFRGNVVDDLPGGKRVGYVTMRDGSVIECYSKFNIKPILCVVALVILAAIGGILYLKFMQPKDASIGDLVIKKGTDNNVVSYNGFMAIRDDELSVEFQNGDCVSTIQVVGDGITCSPVTLQPGEYLATIPVTYNTDAGVINAELHISTDTSSAVENIVVEIPDNNTPSSPDTGLEGYWKGEYVYGVDVQSIK